MNNQTTTIHRDGDAIVIDIPMNLRRRSGHKEIILPPDGDTVHLSNTNHDSNPKDELNTFSNLLAASTLSRDTPRLGNPLLASSEQRQDAIPNRIQDSHCLKGHNVSRDHCDSAKPNHVGRDSGADNGHHSHTPAALETPTMPDAFGGNKTLLAILPTSTLPLAGEV